MNLNDITEDHPIMADVEALMDRIDAKRAVQILADAKAMNLDHDEMIGVVTTEFGVDHDAALALYLLGLITLIKQVLVARAVAASAGLTLTDITDAFPTEVEFDG